MKGHFNILTEMWKLVRWKEQQWTILPFIKWGSSNERIHNHISFLLLTVVEPNGVKSLCIKPYMVALWQNSGYRDCFMHYTLHGLLF